MVDFRYRADIDGLRAIAVMLVVLYHANLGFPGGFVGVDVFFVISGFLITGLIRKQQQAGEFRLRTFWVRRIRRIIPAATVMVGVTLMAGCFLLMPRELEKLADSAAYQQLMLSNVYFWQDADYFAGPEQAKPLLHTWSLAVEEQFYLGFPLLMILLGRGSNKLTLGILTGLTLAAFIVGEAGMQSHPKASFFLLPTRMWELLIGSVLVFLPIRANRTVWREVCAWTGLSCIVGSACLYSMNTRFPGVGALLPCIGAALMIYANSKETTSLGKLLSHRWIVFVGLISYSLYLWHWPIFAFLHYWHGVELTLQTRLFAVAGSIACGVLSWRFVETPFRRGFAQWRPVFPVSAAVVTATLLISVSIWISQERGLQWRLPVRIYQGQGQNVGLNPRFEFNLAAATREEYPGLGAHDEVQYPIDFLVWGDSHAFALGDLFDALAEEHRLSGVLVGKPGTVPLLGAHRVGAEENLPWNESVMAFISKHHIRRVFLVSRWAVNVAGRETGQTDSLIVDALSVDAGQAESRQVLRRGLDRTLGALVESGVEVYVVKQAPKQPSNARVALATARFFGRETPLGVSLATHLKRQQAANAIIDQVARKYHVATFDPTEFCFNESGHCPFAVGDSHTLYR